MLGLAAEDNPDDPAFDLTQQGERIHDAYLDAQHTGAHHVKTGLEAYKAVAEFYATGPLYELGAVALSAAGTKSLELFKLALEEERAAQETGALASEARAFAAKTRQAAHEAQDAEKAAALTLQAEKAEKEASQLEAGAENMRDMAAHNRELGEETNIIVSEVKVRKDGSWHEGDDPAALDAAIQAKLNSTLPIESEREAAVMEGEVAIMVKNHPRSKIVNFNRPYPNPHAPGNITEHDIETENAIIEVTRMAGGKPSQMARLGHTLANPNGKPIIIYGPRYTAPRAIAKVIEAGAYKVVHNEQELIAALEELAQAG